MNKTNSVKEKEDIKKRIQLKGKTLTELKEYFSEIGEPKFRGEQLFDWMYNKIAVDFNEMRNLPKELREKLNESAELLTLKKINSELSDKSGTRKLLFETKEGHQIESVIIPEGKRLTLCLSTQVGCPLDCKFCATGLMGYKKNLIAGEIFDQYLLASNETGKDEISNIVYMGMGEPLLNFNSTVKSLQLFTDKLSDAMTSKRITVSTAGIAPKIKELADTGINCKLALSLHSCFEDIRNKIMPINKKYSFKENIDACKYYSKKTGTKITFEYVMLKNLNDREKDINALIRLCSQLPSKVNIIPFNSLKHMNPTGFSRELEPTSMKRINEFANKLREKNITVVVRNTQGDDIAAACGQLAVNY